MDAIAELSLFDQVEGKQHKRAGETSETVKKAKLDRVKNRIRTKPKSELGDQNRRIQSLEPSQSQERDFAMS